MCDTNEIGLHLEQFEKTISKLGKVKHYHIRKGCSGETIKSYTGYLIDFYLHKRGYESRHGK